MAAAARPTWTSRTASAAHARCSTRVNSGTTAATMDERTLVLAAGAIPDVARAGTARDCLAGTGMIMPATRIAPIRTPRKDRLPSRNWLSCSTRSTSVMLRTGRRWLRLRPRLRHRQIPVKVLLLALRRAPIGLSDEVWVCARRLCSPHGGLWCYWRRRVERPARTTVR